MFLAMLLFFYYRATMNAFLNAKIISMPINSYEEVLKSNMELLVYSGYITETMFKLSPPGSLFNDIYLKKLKDKKRMDDYEGIDGSIQRVIDGDAIIFSSLDPFYKKPDYPCDIVEVKALK